jgi:hypothetical protein
MAAPVLGLRHLLAEPAGGAEIPNKFFDREKTFLISGEQTIDGFADTDQITPERSSARKVIS